MGIFDFLKPARPTYNTQQVAEIILAIGTGGYPAQLDFTATWDKLVEVLYKNKNDQRIVDLLYFELIAARLSIFFLACFELRYKPVNATSAKLAQAFADATKKFFSESQNHYKENLHELFRYRLLSYSKAFETAENDNKIEES